MVSMGALYTSPCPWHQLRGTHGTGQWMWLRMLYCIISNTCVAGWQFGAQWLLCRCNGVTGHSS
jgi:hypothetical protein